MRFLLLAIALAMVLVTTTALMTRTNVNHLSPDEIKELQRTLKDLEDDDSPTGYQAIAAYHGYPGDICSHKGQKIACCLHGMPTFPLWHRLYVTQMELALQAKGLHVGIPYWDWTEPLTSLPQLVQEPIFLDAAGGKNHKNYWHEGKVGTDGVTARAVDNRLFEQVAAGENTRLMEEILLALEQTDFCHFEIQFEVAHNAIHYLVGGRHHMSMSSLEYTSYDPIFFLYHSNVDRIFYIWQKLQELRGLPSESSNCGIEQFSVPMEPFKRKTNPFRLTQLHSKPSDAFNTVDLGYDYDDIKLNGLSIPELKFLLDKRQQHGRAFASFYLHGIGGSANVAIDVCVPDGDHKGRDHCTFAGDFFILGGKIEMPWTFYYNYKFDVTKAVHALGLNYNDNFYVKQHLTSVNGTAIPGDTLRPAFGFHEHAPGFHDPSPKHVDSSDLVVRKDISRLTREEVYNLRQALTRFKNDQSVDGFSAIAEYHGLPPRCPRPDAKDRYACCNHGMANFPHWHRLYMVQVEDAMVHRGSPVGLPYWDWSKPMTELPSLVTDETYDDPHTSESIPNPFYEGFVESVGNKTNRDVNDELFEQPTFGDHTHLFDGVLLALEQDNYCDFEVQLEIIHNLPHLLIGGSAPYSMATLHYTAYDPIFYLYHSNVDRLWAIWVALQRHRGKPFRAHCAWSVINSSLKPFSFESPLNNNVLTQKHAVPSEIYDYESELHYTYDSLEFGGMGIAELDSVINNRKLTDRTFVGFHLCGIKGSGYAHYSVVNNDNGAKFEGKFAILGGELEMDWAFDRLYKTDITDQLISHDWTKNDIHVTWFVTSITGDDVDINGFPAPTILFEAAQNERHGRSEKIVVRKNAKRLSNSEIHDLNKALTQLQEDSTNAGFKTMGEYHGKPKWCSMGTKKVACCAHGMAIFPHWHRLHVVQFEAGLQKYNYHGGVPYWDWTQPMTSLPSIVIEPEYEDQESGEIVRNPFYEGVVESDDGVHVTSRKVKDELYEQPAFGEYTNVAKQVMMAFEQEDFCKFEIQFEIAHNEMHALVGGIDEYSMASLRYTAFDPIFYLHHSNVDRLWAIWQALQKYRGKSYNTANCALQSMRKPIEPFSMSSVVNPYTITRENSIPFDVFDYESSFHYTFDNLEFNGLSIPQLDREVKRRKDVDRVFAGFLLHGTGETVAVKFSVFDGKGHGHEAGHFYILGDEFEMSWSYDHVFKYEITDVLEKAGIHHDDRFTIKYWLYGLDSKEKKKYQPYPTPSVIYEPAAGTHGNHDDFEERATSASHIRKNIDSLTEGEKESLRAAFLALKEDGYDKIAEAHGHPALCSHNSKAIGCCLHGMATFPHWHRVFEVAVEEKLLERGSSVGVPYWDWSVPFAELPAFIDEATYYNSRQQRFDPNPFFNGDVQERKTVTTRDPQPQLFNTNYFYENLMYAFEQENFCDFEIQMEIVHNAIHSWVGGRAEYSLSSLDWTAYDPLFFLHHSTVDWIWAIWQELQRYRKLSFNSANCAINQMGKPMEPFSSVLVFSQFVKSHAKPDSVFDYQNNLDYKYDTLEFHHMNIPKLDSVLHERQSHDRVFAGFLLHNIGTSADVRIFICVPTGHNKEECDNQAGVFSILGGEFEMPFTFDRLYKYDITPTILNLGLVPGHSDFSIKIDIHAVNGSYLNPHLLPSASIIFEPGHDESHVSDLNHGNLVRKDIDALTPSELDSLMMAMHHVQEDRSADGYQSIASFHALPPLCPSPESASRYACCLHGMATFPQWHRLYVVQMEDALRRQGSTVGMPYWDWTQPISKIPDFFVKSHHINTEGVSFYNPFHKATIKFENTETIRLPVVNHLFNNNWLHENIMLALEQEEFCDFEVQFELVHNSIHNWVGGSEKYSLSHLHYASYDPMFYVHHSMTDRIFAVWQELQEYRGHHSDRSNCALELMSQPLKPFSFGEPYNLNPITTQYSKPEDTFDYKNHLKYEYDDLEIGGMSISQLDNYLRERKEHDRVFAGFLLKGFGASGSIDFNVCNQADDCQEAGYFEILGGSAEMPWHFNRLYKYDITKTLDDMELRYDDPFTIQVHLNSIHGEDLSNVEIPSPSIIYEPAEVDYRRERMTPNRVRRNINNLDERDIRSLSAALLDMMNDHDFQHIASFHGYPLMCDDVVCCRHGMATFPHWHRLFTTQFEMALRSHGSSSALPYWDWTQEMKELPKLLTQPKFYDIWTDEVLENPFSRGHIDFMHTYTVRDVQPELFSLGADSKHSLLYDGVLLTLEQEDFCDFEVQFEVLHNAIHYLVGGHHKYSMSSLGYTAYDPLFYIHHSQVDRIWAIWQELQKFRKLPHNSANCALNEMSDPMQPFNNPRHNDNIVTRAHAIPNTVFDYEELGYTYDNLQFDGMSVEELQSEIDRRKSHARVFAGFLLKGFEQSADVHFSVCKTTDDCVDAGFLMILGGVNEMPWAFDRLFKYDITPTLAEFGIPPEDMFNAESPFHLEVKINNVMGESLPASTLPVPSIIYVPATEADDVTKHASIGGVGVRKNLNSLTESEIDNVEHALEKVKNDRGPNGFQAIASYHGLPKRCREHLCCLHGMYVFPHWHRLYMKQMEDALTAQGAEVGLPYWDWTQSFTHLPALVTDEDSPFHNGEIIFANQVTVRDPVDKLFHNTEQGEQSYFFRHVLYAFEQTNLCDFEIQFEITHNSLHFWIGGQNMYSVATLEYTSYDPIFYLFHANADRLYAIWQSLQKYRGLPYNTAYCAIRDLKIPMRPFSDSINPNPVTRSHSKPQDVFNYDRLNYQYDNLEFHGMTIPALEKLLNERQNNGRAFFGLLLRSVGMSVDVSFDICRDDIKECRLGGTFAVLGSPDEMPWGYDRQYKYEITNVLRELNLRPDSEFHFHIHIQTVNGTTMSADLFGKPEVIYVPGSDEHSVRPNKDDSHTNVLLRKDINSLSLDESNDLKNALYKLKNDDSHHGFEHIAGLHAYPNKCPENGDNKYACCAHGMPIFPHWHRLLTVQFEQELKAKGAHTAIPYWDWTAPITSIPSLFGDPSNNNPFYSFHISGVGETERDVSGMLADPPKFHNGEYDYLFYMTLLTLEEDNYCDFEVQYEIVHNAVHYLIGGNKLHSMSSLDYSAFDPFFMIHHSSIDRIWNIWQELQHLRHRPFNGARCAEGDMDHPIHPFSFKSLNPLALTRDNSHPSHVFDNSRFGYDYDGLELNGFSVEALHEEISSLRNTNRYFAGFVLYGFGFSATIEFSFIDESGSKQKVGIFHILGGKKEMPWAYERLFKYDITDKAQSLGMNADSNFKFSLDITALGGANISSVLADPVIVHRPARVHYDVVIIQVGDDHTLPNKIVVKKGTKIEFHATTPKYEEMKMIELGSFTHYAKCIVPSFSYNTYDFHHVYPLSPGDYYFSVQCPDACNEGKRVQISVQNE